MVLDILFSNGEIIQFILPGVYMHYGGCRAVDKVVAFLWALYLVAGLEYEVLAWIISMIASLTTDHGTEIGMVDCPDILKPWLRRLMGTPMDVLVGTVHPDTRLFWRALRIPGWSHMWANIMHDACKRCANWPVLLNICRALCSFYRNDSWRKTLAEDIQDQHPTAAKDLRSFKGSLKKWRYETIAVVFKELLRMREITERFLRNPERIFKNFQDSKLLVDVATAAKAGWFWIFVKVFYTRVLSKCESARRWGLVCICCQHLRREGQMQSRCPRASRKLQLARKFLHEFSETMATAGRCSHSLDECEGNDWVLTTVTYVERSTAALVVIKGKWTTSVPVLIVEAEDPDIAKECAVQIRSGDYNTFSPLLRMYHDTLLPELDAFVCTNILKTTQMNKFT